MHWFSMTLLLGEEGNKILGKHQIKMRIKSCAKIFFKFMEYISIASNISKLYRYAWLCTENQNTGHQIIIMRLLLFKEFGVA